MNTRGFTLIEAILYLALFSILMTGILSSVNVLFESVDRSQTRAMLEEEKGYLLGKITFALSGAKDIAAPAASSSGSILSVTKYDASVITVESSGSDLIYNGAILNNTNVSITGLTFIHIHAGETSPESLEAGFTISTRTPNGRTISQIASTTRYIRK